MRFSLTPSTRPSVARRVMQVLATAATAALLAVSVPFAANAVPVADAPAVVARSHWGGPVAMAVGDQSIQVKVAAIRTGDTVAAPLAGVTLELRSSAANTTDSPGAPVAQPWSTCTSLADGTCTFVVPNTTSGGTNNGKRFWVVQTGAPADYYLNPTLITGNNTNSGSERFAQTPYVYRTPALTGGGTISLPSMTGMPTNSAVGAPLSADGATADRWKTGGNLAISQANNRFQTTCTPGLKVAILFDLSTSMSTNSNQGLNGAKDAAKALVNAFIGTGAQVALYTFGTNAPKNNSASGQNYPTLTTVTAGSAVTLNGYIDGYSASDSTNYTNWDRGLYQLAQASGAFDMAIVLTDGNPTVYGPNASAPSGQGAWTTNRHVEEAIYSANALKDEGTQILTFGVGEGVSAVTGDNLRAVSGTQEWTGTGSIANYDYAKTNDWGLVASQLKALAAGLTCKVPIKVIKTEKLLNGTTQLGQGWTFGATKTGSGTLTGVASQATGANGEANWSLDFGSPTDKGTVTITETIQSVSWALESVVCTNNGTQIYSGNSLSFSLPDLTKGDNIVCNVTNKQLSASVKVDKVWIINGGAPLTNPTADQLPTGLSAQLALSGANQAWGNAKDVTVNGTVIIKETMTTPALCTVTGQLLTGLGTAQGGTSLAGTNTFTTPALPTGQTVYTVTNKVTCTSELKLVKNVTNDNGGTAVPGDWTLFYGATGVTSGTTSTVAAGSYALTESTKAGYGPRATNPLVCSQGLSGTTVTVPLATSVTCTFYNDDIAPTLTLEKIVVGAPGVPATNWTLTAKDGATTVVSGNGLTAVTTVKANTPYTLAEAPNSFPGASDFDASQWECQTNGAGQWVKVPANGILASIGLDDDVVCHIINTAKGADPIITKTVSSFVQNTDGTWTITYTVTVTNPNKYAGITYDLGDTLAFGGSITKTATATGPSTQAASWNGVGNTVLADDTALGANAAHVYTITAIATVPNGASGAVTACPTGTGNGGFMNHAVLTVAGKDYPAQACATPVKPTFQKDPGTATNNADGTYTLTYTLTATNATSIPLYFDLVDDPQATFPAGVTVLSGSVSPAGSWNPLSNTTVADDAVLAANSSKSYTITVVISIAPSVTATTLDCSVQGKGLLNSATLTSGNQVITDDACLTVTPPTIVHDKTVTSTTQNPDGTWAIVYDVVVKNTGSTSGLYDLSDELHVAVTDTISVVSASAAGIPTWDGAANQVLADDKLIAPGDANWQHYTITVVASVAAGKTGTPATRCAADSGTNGFLNTATITVAGVPTADSACSSPTKPVFTKTIVESAPAGANTWNVKYLLTVDNSTAGAKGVYYTLTDVPGFSSELTINSYTVTETSADPDVDVPWNDGNLVTTPRALAGGSIDVYAVVINVTVPAGVPDADLKCTETNTPGHGFQNAASVVVGTDTLTGVACGDVEKSAVPTITKKVVDGWPKQLSDGTWEIKYDVTVTSDSVLAAKYTLADELGYGAGIVVNSAAITSTDATPAADWNGDDNTTVVTNVTLPGGDEHVFHVTVNASVPKSSYTSGATACDPDEVANGGFLNTATLTSGKAEPQTAADCASPAQPEVVKVVDPNNPPALQGDGSWLVTYLVTVTNPSALQLTYDLDDSLGFPDGVTISGQTATGPDGAIDGWDGEVDTALATHATIDANDEHVYTITVNAKPTAGLDLDDVECTEVPTPGHGLFNGVELNSGGIKQDDDACVVLPVSELTLVKQVDNSAFDGLDLDGATLATASDWVLAAEGPVNISGATGTDEVTTVLVPSGSYDLAEGVDLGVKNPLLSSYVAGDWDCGSAIQDGSSVTLAEGGSVTCTIVNTGKPVDLKIVKTSGGEADGQPLVPTDVGSGFEYTFVVTNQGEIDATGVVVTDAVPATLKVDTTFITLPAGWTVELTGADSDGFGGTLTLTKAGVFAVDEVATFVFSVTTAETLPREGDDPVGKILDIENTAIVGSNGVEATPTDNTSTNKTPVKSIVVAIQAVCVKDAPYATWSVTPINTDTIQTPTIVLIWWTEDAYAARDTSIPSSDTAAILADGAEQVDVLPEPAVGWVAGVPVSGTQLWPGGAVDPVTGEGIAWPGWVKEADGSWVLDPSAPFFDIHEKAILEVRMNPSSGSAEAYPPATPECAAFPPFDPPTLPLPPDIPKLAMTGVSTLFISFGLGGVLLGFGFLATVIARLRRKTTD